MDKLEEIFALQRALNEDITTRRDMEEIPTDQWIQKLTLAMLSEMAEVLDEVNFKWWKNPKPLDTDALRDELVDVFHFFVSMCLRSGMDAQELYARYLAKNEENFRRQQGTSEKKGYSIDEA